MLENTGVLQEVNRTFFNPLGLNLILKPDLTLDLQKADNDYGIAVHTIDKFKLGAFNAYRMKRHERRQQRLGFIIQTQDFIRGNKFEEEDINLASPESLKLNTLLRCIDNIAYRAKRRLMENSHDKDKDAQSINYRALYHSLEVDIANSNYVDAIAKSAILLFESEIDDKIEKIKKDKEKKDKLFKKEK